MKHNASSIIGEYQGIHWHIVTQPLSKPFITYHFINLLNATAVKNEVRKEQTRLICQQTVIK